MDGPAGGARSREEGSDMMTVPDLVVQDVVSLRVISDAYESAAVAPVKTILPPVSPFSIVSKP